MKIMKAEARQSLILDLLADNQQVAVGEISDRLGVSQVTIRNDLNSLSDKGLVTRSHGGASSAFHSSILSRQRSMQEVKNRIAKAAAAMVNDGDTIMIDAGTTTALMAKHLVGKRDVRVVTSNLLVLPNLRNIPSVHLTLVGGEYRPSTESMVGPMTLRALEEFHVSKAFVGTDGFSLEKGMTTHLVEGAEVVRKLRQQSDRTILLTDSSKVNQTGFARILPMDAMDHIVTDNGLPTEVVAGLKKLNIELTTVEPQENRNG